MNLYLSNSDLESCEQALIKRFRLPRARVAPTWLRTRAIRELCGGGQMRVSAVIDVEMP